MAIVARGNSGQEFERLAPGMYGAVCCNVVDVGVHEQEYNGAKKDVHQVYICFEVDKLMTQGEYAGKPFMVSKRFTLSLHEKADLAKTLEQWFGKTLTPEQRKDGIDLEKCIGKLCTLNLVQTQKGDKTYTNISAVLPMLPGAKVLKIVCKDAPKWILEYKAKAKTEDAWPEDTTPTPTEEVPPPTDQDAPPPEDDLPF